MENARSPKQYRVINFVNVNGHISRTAAAAAAPPMEDIYIISDEGRNLFPVLVSVCRRRRCRFKSIYNRGRVLLGRLAAVELWTENEKILLYNS